jgi:putative hydrolase
MLKNSGIAELLAREAETAEGHLQKALRRAARLACMWPEEAAAIHSAGGKLTELAGVGPHLQRLIVGWIEGDVVAPEPELLRRNFLTLTDARTVLSRNLKWAAQLRGDLQMHTQFSDGSGTVDDMAAAAEERGYEYIAITDHSQELSIANGMDERRLRLQGEAIDETNARLAARDAKLRVLKSIEMNLNPAGEGDMSSDALAKLDLVLGSFHSALRRKEDQTERYLAALRNPDIQVLGHPRGRVYNYRAGLNADWPRVFAEAAALDKALEIDSYVDRQDLSIELLAHAREAGVRISIGTDAHAPSQLGFIELGLAAALLAKISPDRILNFMARDQLLAWSKSVRVKALQRTRPVMISTGAKLKIRPSAIRSWQEGFMAKRELINTGTDKRFVRRNSKGQFKESDDVGKSLAADRRVKAKTKSKSGQGDKGDR